MRKLRSKLAFGAATAGRRSAGGDRQRCHLAVDDVLDEHHHTRPRAEPLGFPAPGTAAHEDAEEPVTGTAAAKAQAARSGRGGGTAGPSPPTSRALDTRRP